MISNKEIVTAVQGVRSKAEKICNHPADNVKTQSTEKIISLILKKVPAENQKKMLGLLTDLVYSAMSEPLMVQAMTACSLISGDKFHESILEAVETTGQPTLDSLGINSLDLEDVVTDSSSEAKSTSDDLKSCVKATMAGIFSRIGQIVQNKPSVMLLDKPTAKKVSENIAKLNADVVELRLKNGRLSMSSVINTDISKAVDLDN